MWLQVVRQADARVGHDRLATTRLDGVPRTAVTAGAVELVAVERVVAGELVTQFVGHVVDSEEVTDRSRQTRAAAGLVCAADHAEVGDTAARLPQPEVADVVVARADDLADHDALAAGLATENLGLGVTAGGRRRARSARIASA